MFNLLFILLFATTATFSVKSMEMKSDKKEKKVKKSSILSRKTSTKNFNTTISTTPLTIPTPLPEPEHPFVMAVGSNNKMVITMWLSNTYFNPNTYRYQPAFHACIENKHYHLLPLLFADPRIDTSIRNNSLQMGHAILKQRRLNEPDSILKKQIYEWQMKTFAHCTLHLTTKEMCDRLKTLPQNHITNLVIIDAIEMIKEKIKQVATRQTASQTEGGYVEDRKLPKESACFPDYATNEFMTKKIQFLLSNDNQKV